MMKKILLTMVLLLCFSASAIAGKTIVVAVPATIAPMAFVGDDGELTGYSVDYIKALAKAGGFELELKNIPWSGIFSGLVKGEYDAICGAVSITDERKKVVDFTNAYYEVSNALVVGKKSKVKSLVELKGKPVGGKNGSTSFQALTKVEGIQAKGYADVDLLFEALNGHEVEAVVYDEIMLHYIIEKQYKETVKIAAILNDGVVEQLGIAVKKGDTEVLDMLNKAMVTVKGSAAEKEIQKKWLGDRAQ